MQKKFILRQMKALVIGLGVFALLAGLAGLGVIDPLFNSK